MESGMRQAKRGPRLPVAPSQETATVKAILQFLALHRIPAWRINTGAVKIERRFLRFGAVGMSDIIGLRATHADSLMGKPVILGRFLAIEVKAAKGKVTPAQQAFLDRVQAAGGKAFVARSVADVARELELPC